MTKCLFLVPDLRALMYKQGGLFSVTPRILVTDMLEDIVPVELISGLIVLHAEE